MTINQIEKIANKNKYNQLVKPFLKWAGGKRQLLAELRRNMPKSYENYYEPFIGGGALFFDVQPQKAVINDSNSELINCYQVIKASPEKLIESLNQHKNEINYYYKLRDLDRENTYSMLSSVERASRIIYLNKTCYNGLFRVNSQGQFNVPFGKYKNPDIVNIAVIKAVHKYLNENYINMLNTDFEKALSTAKKGDFIYLDPPYDPISDTSSFTGYDVNGFDREEQERLKLVVDKLHVKGCKFLLSNAYTEFIIDLYKNYKQIKISAVRAINSNADKRGKVDEILVKNYD
ncbi:DNA methyltransferase [Aphanothece hegewaldii CCALA 016]|uniref:Site-specific DNA-methyltransferase (adenine-specific) n=1 Tax=Aphanothece hegewaldii CCALA 016 TaxID=2107694 RepID=A0A2T1LYW8_9CHRO|nr:DNA adenine methylase [Aphanothece hegewaldii]PSF37605.1 DNA methyltransferase [Aphanothece hegewaldii CCALA 016]